MKLTRHNGRAGKSGVYNPKHNDRSFDIANSEHIDEERAKQNLYWDCYNGFRNFKNPDKENELSATFEDVEQLFYRQRYRDFVTGQNERNVKNRHPERNKETGDLLKSKKTCPEETVYQIGTLDNHVPPELLIEIVTEFMEIVNERFGSHVHILNWALHLDESTPHIHERHVFDCENQYGEIAPQQEKALEALGFELPEPEKPVGRKNNRKMTFDSACRVLLFDVAKKHGLQLEEEPEYGGRAYLEKQDYILFKQKEQLAAQEQKLEELTMKIEDVEALVDEVADIAYDKAVEVVADTVKLETHKEDIKLVEQSKAWVLSPERIFSFRRIGRNTNILVYCPNSCPTPILRQFIGPLPIRHQGCLQALFGREGGFFFCSCHHFSSVRVRSSRTTLFSRSTASSRFAIASSPLSTGSGRSS